MSIFGRSETPTSPPRKHNHFVPDGYIPPKSRQKTISPPAYARMLKVGGSPHRPPSRPASRQRMASPYRETPTPRNQNQNVLPYAEFSRPPSRPDSRQDVPLDRKATLRSILKKYDSPQTVHSNHENPLPEMMPTSPSRSPAPYTQPSPSHRKPNPPRGVMKQSPPRGTIKPPPRTPPMSRPRTPPLQYSNPPRSIIKAPPETPPMSRSRTPPEQHHSYSNTPRGILKPNSPRGILKKSASSPKSPPVSRPRTPPAQQYCDMGGTDDDDYTPPPSRQRKAPTPQSSGFGPGTKRSPPSEGSQSSYGPISVLDKYDTRESHVWQPHYPPGRVPPAKSSRGRPRVRNPNIIFNRIVDAQDDGGASCSSRSPCCEEEDEDEEDEYCRKLYAPCAPPLDWDRDPLLRSVDCEERQAYRQCKLDEYLHEICARQKQSEPPEGFESYLIRCYAYANVELNAHNSKHILGYVDHRLSPLDVWVLRLCRGAAARLGRMGTSYPNRDIDFFLRVLREECVALHSQRGTLLRRHLQEGRRSSACDEQERNYKKILLLSQRSPMGVMQHLRQRDWR